MKAIMVMFDSLNRHLLPPYGGDWVRAPNFAHLAELDEMELVPPFAFTKGCRVLRFPARIRVNPHPFGHLLFDLEQDPGQEHPMVDEAVEERMIGQLARLMRESDAPADQYQRLGLTERLENP